MTTWIGITGTLKLCMCLINSTVFRPKTVECVRTPATRTTVQSSKSIWRGLLKGGARLRPAVTAELFTRSCPCPLSVVFVINPRQNVRGRSQANSTGTKDTCLDRKICFRVSNTWNCSVSKYLLPSAPVFFIRLGSILTLNLISTLAFEPSSRQRTWVVYI